jgi:hypothetical protein
MKEDFMAFKCDPCVHSLHHRISRHPLRMQ